MPDVRDFVSYAVISGYENLARAVNVHHLVRMRVHRS